MTEAYAAIQVTDVISTRRDVESMTGPAAPQPTSAHQSASSQRFSIGAIAFSNR